MKTLVAILAAITLIASQSQSVQGADCTAGDFSGVITVAGDELQKVFEEEALAAAMKNTKRVTDAVVFANYIRLSAFANTRRHIRALPEFGQVPGQSMEFGGIHKEFHKWVLPSAREMNTVRYCTFPN